MTAAEPDQQGVNWYAVTTLPAPERAPLVFDLDVDVCVIGGGLAGLTVAREVARRQWSVAVLEARKVGGGASGNNCGFVVPGFEADIGKIVERVGFDQAKALWDLSESGVDYVRRTIRETKMPGVKPVDGWLSVAKFHEDPAIAATAAFLSNEFGTEVEAWPAARVRGVLKSPYYRNAAYYPRAFHIHPMNYALGLAAVAESDGARIFENTPALSIDASGIRKRIHTPSARVRAAHVVFAGNTGLGVLAPHIAATLLPVTSYVAVTAPLGPRLAEAVTFPGAVSDTQFADNHYRIVDGDRLMWAGGVTLWKSNPRRFARRLAKDIRRTFPQLENVTIESVVSGTFGRAVHSMPQIGEISPGLWQTGAFGSRGLNTTAMAGELTARGIVEGDQTWRLFAPYDLVWSGGAFGRIAAQAMYWSLRASELFQAQTDRLLTAPAMVEEDDALALTEEPVLPALKRKADATGKSAARSRKRAGAKRARSGAAPEPVAPASAAGPAGPDGSSSR